MLLRRNISLLILLAFLAAGLGAETPGNLFQMGSPGTVQLKYGLLLDGRNAKNPDQVNLFLKTLGLKPLGSTINLSSGTGIVLTADGKILTNAHVVLLSAAERLESRVDLLKLFVVQYNIIDNMTATERQKKGIPSFSNMSQLASDLGFVINDSPIVLQLQVNNMETRSVRILAADPERDLALVQSDFVDLKPLRLGDSAALQVGDDVVALGYPLGSTLEDMFSQVVTTMTKGSVSALRKANLGIQHTASISHGNSGGPLLNIAGEVVGVNSAGITEANNLNLAIPSNAVKQFLMDIKYENVVKENEALAVPVFTPNAAPALSKTKGKGLVTVNGFAPGTKLSLSYEGGFKDNGQIVPADGILVLHSLPFGPLRIEADVPVYDKIYYPSFVDGAKTVKISGYPAGLTLRLDDTKDYVVPANGILELPTDDKQHTLYALPGWGRGFQTNVEITDESNYTVTFASGTLAASGFPPKVDVTVNGEIMGKSDDAGSWTSTGVPIGPAKVGLSDRMWVALPQETVIGYRKTSALVLKPKLAGRLALSSSQKWPELLITLMDADGKPQALSPPAGTEIINVQLGEGTYRLLARLADDVADFAEIPVTVNGGKTTELALPAIAHTSAWDTQQQNLAAERKRIADETDALNTRLAAEKKLKSQNILRKLFFAGIQGGEPVPYAAFGGINLNPVEIKVGVSWFPSPNFFGLTGTAGYWFAKTGSFAFGAGVSADYFKTETQWEYGGAAEATVTYSIVQIGPSLLAKWKGFAVDVGAGWVIRHRTMVDAPADGIGFHVLAGWFFNY